MNYENSAVKELLTAVAYRSWTDGRLAAGQCVWTDHVSVIAGGHCRPVLLAHVT